MWRIFVFVFLFFQFHIFFRMHLIIRCLFSDGSQRRAFICYRRKTKLFTAPSENRTHNYRATLKRRPITLLWPKFVNLLTDIENTTLNTKLSSYDIWRLKNCNVLQYELMLSQRRPPKVLKTANSIWNLPLHPRLCEKASLKSHQL